MSFSFLFIFMDTGILLACLSGYHMHGWCPQRPEKDIGSGFPGTRDTYSCERHVGAGRQN